MVRGLGDVARLLCPCQGGSLSKYSVRSLAVPAVPPAARTMAMHATHGVLSRHWLSMTSNNRRISSLVIFKFLKPEKGAPSASASGTLPRIDKARAARRVQVCAKSVDWHASFRCRCLIPAIRRGFIRATRDTEGNASGQFNLYSGRSLGYQPIRILLENAVNTCNQSSAAVGNFS